MMQDSERRFQVVCLQCGQVWQPEIGSSLWWKAKKNADKGYLDPIHVNGGECGCIDPVVEPEAPYRVIGYNDLCEDFDIPFFSLVAAARKYLELARDGMYIVFFVDKRTEGTRQQSRVEQRLYELKWS